MKLFSKLKKIATRALPFGVVAVMALGMVSFIKPASALELPSSCKYADNEVIWCGVSTPKQIIHDYTYGDGHNSQASIQHIYGWNGSAFGIKGGFGITAADIHAMPNTAVAGKVDRNGDVYVGSRLVATHAISAGRLNISGSKKEVYKGTTFYVRPPSVSYVSGVNSLDAFVVMQNDQFAFAILSSCGNPVVAVPTPAPKKPVQKPAYTIHKYVAYDSSNHWHKAIAVNPNTTVKYRVVIDSTGKASRLFTPDT